MNYAAYGAQADTRIAELTGMNEVLKGVVLNRDKDLRARDTLIVELKARIYALETPDPIYGPKRISDIAELAPPAGFNYVIWKWKVNTPLQDVFSQLKDNDVLVLPEDDVPYLIDTTKGFRRDARHDIAMARTRAGIIGMGPGAVIDLGPSTFTQGPNPKGAENRNKVIECWTAKAVIANFTMHGRDLGGVSFDAIKGAAPDIRMERLLLQGAHRGTSAAPPNEAGGMVNHKADRMAIRRCEVDCRDPKSGKSVGSSPIMLNVSNGCLIEDTYVHHASVGAPTAWSLKDLWTRRLRSEYNSSGFNHELVEGVVEHQDATFIIDRKGRSSGKGSHLSMGTNRPSATYRVSVRDFDAGYESEPLKFFIQHFNGAPYVKGGQKDSDITVTGLDGNSVPIFFGR